MIPPRASAVQQEFAYALLYRLLKEHVLSQLKQTTEAVIAEDEGTHSMAYTKCGVAQPLFAVGESTLPLAFVSIRQLLLAPLFLRTTISLFLLLWL